jgi:hypothetical protein
MKHLLTKIYPIFFLVSACDTINMDEAFVNTPPPVEEPNDETPPNDQASRSFAQQILAQYQPKNTPITASIFGQVLDENGVPVVDARISGEDMLTFSDEEGYFILKDKQLNAEGTLLTISKQGYFEAFDRLYLEGGSYNQTEVRLLAKERSGTFDGALGGMVSHGEQLAVQFPASAIVDGDGNIHEGIVDVYAQYIDPTSEDIASVMPGDLVGLDEDAEENVLASYGMVAIELVDKSGRQLNIKEGMRATIEVQVPSSKLQTAPATIPLWYFDTAVGLWVLNGEATLQGDRYIGEVSHFSYWNCDAPFPLIPFSADIKDKEGNPVPNTKVTVRNLLEGVNRYSMTDHLGRVKGLIPRDMNLEVIAGENSRCSSIDAQEVAAGQTEVYLSMEYQNIKAKNVLVSVRATDCSGEPVSNGLVEILYNGSKKRVYVSSEGTRDVILSLCEWEQGDVSVRVIDLDTREIGRFTTYSRAALEGNNPTLELSSCGTTDIGEYISVTINGQRSFIKDYETTIGGPCHNWSTIKPIEDRIPVPSQAFIEVMSLYDPVTNELTCDLPALGVEHPNSYNNGLHRIINRFYAAAKYDGYDVHLYTNRHKDEEGQIDGEEMITIYDYGTETGVFEGKITGEEDFYKGVENRISHSNELIGRFPFTIEFRVKIF